MLITQAVQLQLSASSSISLGTYRGRHTRGKTVRTWNVLWLNFNLLLLFFCNSFSISVASSANKASAQPRVKEKAMDFLTPHCSSSLSLSTSFFITLYFCPPSVFLRLFLPLSISPLFSFSCRVFYLLLICIDPTEQASNFADVKRGERALQYTMFSVLPYRSENEKQMTPLCADVQPPRRKSFEAAWRNWKRSPVHLPGQWQPSPSVRSLQAPE